MQYHTASTDALMFITKRPDLVFERGEGSWLFDHQGKAYLDFIQGWAVNCLGHCPPEIADALATQGKQLINPSPAFYNGPMVELASLLTANSVFDRVFFANSGAEANEGAIKLARKWGRLHKGGAYEIITFDHAFHGRTLATMSASGKPGWDTLYAPQVPGFPKADLNDIASVEALINEKTVAVMLEPIQGEAGVIPAEAAFLKALRELTQARGLLLIVDEVQTGMGRTGKLFAMDHYDDKPDLMTMAKSLAGGMPLSGVVGNANIMDAPAPGGLGGTYAGNPLAVAAAHAVLNIIDKESLCERANQLGQRLKNTLIDAKESVPAIAAVRGLGSMIAVEFNDPQTGEPSAAIAQKIQQRALAQGLLLLTCGAYGNVIRFLYPLTIPDAQFDAAMKILQDALSD